MSILGSIFSKVLGHHPAPTPASPAPTPASDTTPTPPIAGTPPAQTSAGTPAPSAPAPGTPAPGTQTTAGTASGGTPPAKPAGGAPVDVAAMLDGLAQKSGQTLDWKHSIVDMLKLLDLDSSLASRQALAKELNYSGDMHDSATMNIWLHSQVMAKLAQNGGKVPDDLRH